MATKRPNLVYLHLGVFQKTVSDDSLHRQLSRCHYKGSQKGPKIHQKPLKAVAKCLIPGAFHFFSKRTNIFQKQKDFLGSYKEFSLEHWDFQEDCARFSGSDLPFGFISSHQTV